MRLDTNPNHEMALHRARIASAPQKPREATGTPTLERDHEHAGDQLMARYGFEVIRMSQPRASMVTEGIPDRLYCSTARGIQFYWEAKREDGKQSAAQKRFEATVTACGAVYFCGTFPQLSAWFASQVERGWPMWRIVLEGALGRLDDEGVGRVG